MAYEYDKKYDQQIIFGSEYNIDQGGNIISFGEESQGIVIPRVPLFYRNLTFHNVIDAKIKHFVPEITTIQPPPGDPEFVPPHPPVAIPLSQPGFGVYSEGIQAFNYFHWNIHDWAMRSYVNPDRAPNSAGWLVAIQGDFTFFKAQFYSHIDEATGDKIYYGENGIKKYEWFIDGKLAKTGAPDDPVFDFDYDKLPDDPIYGDRLWDVNSKGIIRKDTIPWSENTYEVSVRVHNDAGFTESKIKMCVWGGYGNDGESIDINMDVFTEPDFETGNSFQSYGPMHERKGFLYYPRTTPWPPTIERYYVGPQNEAIFVTEEQGPPNHHGDTLGEAVADTQQNVWYWSRRNNLVVMDQKEGTGNTAQLAQFRIHTKHRTQPFLGFDRSEEMSLDQYAKRVIEWLPQNQAAREFMREHMAEPYQAFANTAFTEQPQSHQLGFFVLRDIYGNRIPTNQDIWGTMNWGGQFGTNYRTLNYGTDYYAACNDNYIWLPLVKSKNKDGTHEHRHWRGDFQNYCWFDTGQGYKNSSAMYNHYEFGASHADYESRWGTLLSAPSPQGGFKTVTEDWFFNGFGQRQSPFDNDRFTSIDVVHPTIRQSPYLAVDYSANFTGQDIPPEPGFRQFLNDDGELRLCPVFNVSIWVDNPTAPNVQLYVDGGIESLPNTGPVYDIEYFWSKGAPINEALGQFANVRTTIYP